MRRDVDIVTICIYACLARLSADDTPAVCRIGVLLLFVHLTKDCFAPSLTWPLWTEPFALGMALVLMAHSGAPRAIGLVMLFGHLRQIAIGDNQYYSVP